MTSVGIDKQKGETPMSRVISIEDTITVGSLAEKLMLPVTRLISELMKNGVMVTLNERIDFDTAQIIVGELGLDIKLERQDLDQAATGHKRNRDGGENATTRPPVVAVMGHVDHGKTSLLDVIRGSQVAKHEAGGITQHISAYQVLHDGRKITFLDTPGHEAFAAIREHGAQLTDLVVIVVAADDGIKPQTIEAIRFARQAGSKMIVAITKVDKENADVNRIKQQLSDQNLLIEEWGGDTVVIEVSAKENKGIKELLDMILLVADVEDYRADYDAYASGLIIEAHLEQGRGPIAKALVEEGMLRRGDFIVAGDTYAKIRILEDSEGKSISEAGPSTPVTITGFKSLPRFGDEFSFVSDEKKARDITSKISLAKRTESSITGLNSTELLRIINRSNKLQEFNIILKTDVQGSLKSVKDSLKSLDTDEVAVTIVGSGVGSITENDVHLAVSSKAKIYGFNVVIPTEVRRVAARDKTDVRIFTVIYELIDDVKSEMSQLLVPEVKENKLGTLTVKAIFKTTKSEIICGGEVTQGKLVIPANAYIVREGNNIAEVEITNLKRGQNDTKEVFEGEMCGVSIKPTSKVTLLEKDQLEFFVRQTVERKL